MLSNDEKLKTLEAGVELASHANYQEAKILIEAAKQARVKRCEEKINQALQEERCGLDVAVLITARGNVPQLNIFAQD